MINKASYFSNVPTSLSDETKSLNASFCCKAALKIANVSRIQHQFAIAFLTDLRCVFFYFLPVFYREKNCNKPTLLLCFLLGLWCWELLRQSADELVCCTVFCLLAAHRALATPACWSSCRHARPTCVSQSQRSCAIITRTKVIWQKAESL